MGSQIGDGDGALGIDEFIGHRSPFLSIEETGEILIVGPDGVKALVAEGSLLAINIATPGSRNRSLRIYRYSACHLLVNPELPLTVLTIDQLLQHGRPTWRLDEVADLLRCTGQHVTNLRNSPDCPLAGPENVEDSTGASKSHRRITRSSIIEFLAASAVLPDSAST